MKEISVGQALLILLDKYREGDDFNPELCRLYVCGIQNQEDTNKLNTWLHDNVLSDYIVSDDIEIIDSDPARRYFETQLAYNTLNNFLNKINLQDLTDYYDSLMTISNKKVDWNKKLKFKQSLERINEERYRNLGESNRKKLELLIKITYLGQHNVNNKLFSLPMLPIKQYLFGFYSKKNRGRSTKKDNSIGSSNLGILKSTMPIPRNDIAYVDNFWDFTRAPDQAKYDRKAKWVVANFKGKIHPFINSISGTTIAQLRNAKHLANRGKLPFKTQEEFKIFIACFASAMLFTSGAHSFHEILGVFQLPEVKSSFAFLGSEININEGSILLSDNNIVSLNESLNKAIDYNKAILGKRKLHASLPKNEEERSQFFQEEKDKVKIRENINSLLEHLYKSTNKYVADCLSKYIKETTDAVNKLCVVHNISTINQLKIKEQFLKHLKEINFTDAYLGKIQKSQTDDLVLDYNSFSKFVSKEIPKFSNIKSYMQFVLYPDYEKESQEILYRIKKVRNIINQYKGDQKKSLIDNFNRNVDNFVAGLENTILTKKKKESIESDLNLILEKLEKDECKYYEKLSLFKNLRKSNSSLKPLIMEAKSQIKRACK